MATEGEDVRELTELVLDAVGRETGKERAWISLELEQVVTRAFFEMSRRAGRRRQRPITNPEFSAPGSDIHDRQTPKVPIASLPSPDTRTKSGVLKKDREK